MILPNLEPYACVDTDKLCLDYENMQTIHMNQ